MSKPDIHNVAAGGHELVDVDQFLPTGVCAICEGMALDERLPEDRGPDNPYVPFPEGDDQNAVPGP